MNNNTKNTENTKATEITEELDFDLYDIADDIELELVSIDVVKYLLDIVSADLFSIAKDRETRTEKEEFITNRASRFIDLAIDKIKELETNFDQVLKDIYALAHEE